MFPSCVPKNSATPSPIRMLFFILRLRTQGDYNMISFFEGDSMANHPSAVKRHRQSQNRRLVNQMNRQKLKTQMKKLRAAIGTGQGADAKTLLPETFKVIDRSVPKGVIKKNTARRYKSRLAKRVNALAPV